MDIEEKKSVPEENDTKPKKMYHTIETKIKVLLYNKVEKHSKYSTAKKIHTTTKSIREWD